MSTVTTYLGLTKPASIEQFNLATYNTNLDLVDTRVNLITPQYVALNTSDTNWSYDGGLYVHTDLSGRKLGHLTVRLVRIAGGTVALTTADLQLCTLINSPNYPRQYSVSRYCVLQEGPGNATPGATVWGAYVRVDKDGKLYAAANTGTTNITVGRQLEIDMWWVI